jgi:hypothetical protein
MNGDGPLLSLDPSADGVSYAPVLHRVSLDPNQQTEQCAVALDEARRIAANIAKCKMSAARVSVECRLFHYETFGDLLQSLTLNGTKTSKEFAHHRFQFRFWRHSPVNVIGDPSPLFDDAARGSNDPGL